jgi:bacteriocin-like protein
MMNTNIDHDTERELTDSELNAVVGGNCPITNNAAHCGGVPLYQFPNPNPVLIHEPVHAQ